MVLIDVGEDAVFALSTIDPSTNIALLEGLGSAALKVLLGLEKEETALQGPIFVGVDVDFIKRVYSALVCVFVEAAKNDASQTEMLSFLRSECKIEDPKAERISFLFSGRKDELRAMLSLSGNHSFFPQLEGVDCELVYCMPSPSDETVKDLLYKVGLKLTGREDGKEEKIEFIASVEELQELIFVMKEACNSVERAMDRR